MKPAPKKILAMKLRSLGDTVLMTASLQALHEAFPEAEIHAAVLTAWAPLLERHPAVRKVWSFERHPHAASRAKAVARLALQARRERYDCVVNFHASPSSATIAFASGARVRSIHFHGHRDRNRYSTVEVPGKGVLKPVIERDLDTVRALGLDVPQGLLPRIHLSEAELDQAGLRLAQGGAGFPVLGLGLGASRPTKAWPVERYAELAVQWCSRNPGTVVAVTSAAEEPMALEFLKRVVDTGAPAELRARIRTETRLGVRELSALIARMDIFAGNDSGPRHIAVAVGTPTVTIFGPEDPFEWHPYPEDHHPKLFIPGLPCRRDADPGMPAWCGLYECKFEKLRCMTGIGIEQVLEKIQKTAKSRG